MVVDTVFPNPCRVVAIVPTSLWRSREECFVHIPNVFFRINQTSGENGSSEERILRIQVVCENAQTISFGYVLLGCMNR